MTATAGAMVVVMVMVVDMIMLMMMVVVMTAAATGVLTVFNFCCITNYRKSFMYPANQSMAHVYHFFSIVSFMY